VPVSNLPQELNKGEICFSEYQEWQKGVAMVACNIGVVAFTPYDTSAKFLGGSKPFLTLKHDLGESLPCVNQW